MTRWLALGALLAAARLLRDWLPTAWFDTVSSALQHVGAAEAAGGFWLLGIPAKLDGQLVHLPSVSLDVTATCSGLRTWGVLLATAAVWALWMRLRPWQAAVLLVATLPLTVVANGLRLVSMGVLAEAWGPAMLGGAIGHAGPGLVTYGIALAGFIGLDGALTAGWVARKRRGR